MTRVDDVLESLARHLTPAELVELARRVPELEVEPLGKWQAKVFGKQVAVGAEMSEVYIAHQMPESDEEPGVTLSLQVWHGADDGVPVVQIDGTGRFRVNVNDAPVWDADPELHEHKFCKCVKASQK